MNEKPILFSGPMVRALIEGRKTMTRRVVKVPLHCPNTGCELTPGELNEREISSVDTLCPYGGPGTRLWVRETWGRVSDSKIAYRADAADDYQWGAGKPSQGSFQWKPSIFMPRKFSRITLEVTAVRVERLQEISQEDATAEGIKAFTKDGKLQKYWPCDPCDGELKNTWQDLPRTPRDAFQQLWDSINRKRSPWKSNPFLWVITFKRA